jgi:hypothetical protein
MYSDGRGVARSPMHSVDLWSRACDGGDYTACVELAKLYTSGRGVRADRDRAQTLYKKACDAGFSLGCDGLHR